MQRFALEREPVARERVDCRAGASASGPISLVSPSSNALMSIPGAHGTD